jgi:hypothetical protein
VQAADTEIGLADPAFQPVAALLGELHPIFVEERPEQAEQGLPRPR